MDPISIIGIVLGGLGVIASGYQAALNELAPNTQAKVRELVKKIQDKIANNNTLLDKLNLAYTQRNNGLASSLINGMGFGPRMNAINKAINENDANYREKAKDINRSNAELNKISNELDYANQAAASSIHGAIKANQALKNAEEDIDHVSVVQNINGGIQNG
jgi:chromosome segregation ATPase